VEFTDSDERCNLLRYGINYGRKKLCHGGPSGLNAIKLEFTNFCKKARALMLGKPFQPSLMFAGKDTASLSEAPFSSFTLGQVSWPYTK
jgi:hypothetical protein